MLNNICGNGPIPISLSLKVTLQIITNHQLPSGLAADKWQFSLLIAKCMIIPVITIQGVSEKVR